MNTGRIQIMGAWGAFFFLMALGIAALVLGGMGRPAVADEAADIIAQAKTLSDQEKFEESNALLKKLAETNPNHPDVYWKIAQNYYDLGERVKIEDKQKKLDLYKQCEAWAKKGFERNPGLADNAFWMAVGMSQQAQVNGIAATLLSDRTLAKRIEEYYLKSTQAKEFHYRDDHSNTISSAHMALGMFYRKVPDSILVRLLMGTQGDLDKSVEHQRQALALFPDNIEVNKELAVSLLCRDKEGDAAEAKKYLEAALALPADDGLDRIDHQDCRRLLADPSLACGYSRVQQEEVSEDAFKDK